MKIYSELAPWFHLLTHPKDYAEEADFTAHVIDAVAEGEARTLLELGSGGGNNASHLKRRFDCTLTDISPERRGPARRRAGGLRRAEPLLTPSEKGSTLS